MEDHIYGNMDVGSTPTTNLDEEQEIYQNVSYDGTDQGAVEETEAPITIADKLAAWYELHKKAEAKSDVKPAADKRTSSATVPSVHRVPPNLKPKPNVKVQADRNSDYENPQRLSGQERPLASKPETKPKPQRPSSQKSDVINQKPIKPESDSHTSPNDELIKPDISHKKTDDEQTNNAVSNLYGPDPSESIRVERKSSVKAPRMSMFMENTVPKLTEKGRRCSTCLTITFGFLLTISLMCNIYFGQLAIKKFLRNSEAKPQGIRVLDETWRSGDFGRTINEGILVNVASSSRGAICQESCTETIDGDDKTEVILQPEAAQRGFYVSFNAKYTVITASITLNVTKRRPHSVTFTAKNDSISYPLSYNKKSQYMIELNGTNTDGIHVAFETSEVVTIIELQVLGFGGHSDSEEKCCDPPFSIHSSCLKRCYHVNTDNDMKTKEEAKKYCENNGAYLVSINNQAEHDFLRPHLVNYYDKGRPGFLVGLDKKWIWADGTRLQYKPWKMGRDRSRTTDCVVMRSSTNSLFQDQPCFNNAENQSIIFHFVCEKEASCGP